MAHRPESQVDASLFNTSSHDEGPPPSLPGKVVFEDQGSLALLARVRQLAPSNATVLVTGETGTGKEIVARKLHALSLRAEQPFVVVNCGAFSESLIESDLFGHERGAFTGAAMAKIGWFEAADRGTLFLDEIAELPFSAQSKLLRVLQEREVVRLGSRQPIPVDVRLIAATNVRLEEAVAAGKFREDLYFRLAVAKLSLEPLRNRPADVLPLARHFISAYATRLAKDRREETVPTLTREAEQSLLSHAWPGNIRELENAIQHALLVCSGGEILPPDLALVQLPPRQQSPSLLPDHFEQPLPADPASLDPHEALRRALQALYSEGGPRLWSTIEELVMVTAHQHSRQNQLRTARLLGISRNVVRARLVQFGVVGQPAKSPSEPPDGPSPSVASSVPSFDPAGRAERGKQARTIGDNPSPDRHSHVTPTRRAIDVWYSRAGSATASSLAIRKKWLESELSREGVLLHSLRSAEDEELRNAHYDHQQTGLFREGGNIPSIWARGHGQPTAVVGITWLDEYQGVLTLASSKIRNLDDLRGKRLSIPLVRHSLIDHARGAALHGFVTALGLAGSSLRDARCVDVPIAYRGGFPANVTQRSADVEFAALLDGQVDAVFIRGGLGARLSRDPRFRQLTNLNDQPDPLMRVNNGTPRPITVDRAFLEKHLDVVARYLSVLLRAAVWAEKRPQQVLELIATELDRKLSVEDVLACHGPNVHHSFTPRLTEEYIRGLEKQKDFLLEYGFIAADFEMKDWIVHEPLSAAALLAKEAPEFVDDPGCALAV